VVERDGAESGASVLHSNEFSLLICAEDCCSMC